MEKYFVILVKILKHDLIINFNCLKYHIKERQAVESATRVVFIINYEIRVVIIVADPTQSCTNH